jgi:transposase-like protein
MVTRKRKRYGSQFKFGVALEAIKGQKTINEIASETGVHPNQVRDWKKKLMDEGVTVFGQNLAVQLQEQENRETELYEQIGRLKMELEWLKKKAATYNR